MRKLPARNLVMQYSITCQGRKITQIIRQRFISRGGGRALGRLVPPLKHLNNFYNNCLLCNSNVYYTFVQLTALFMIWTFCAFLQRRRWRVRRQWRRRLVLVLVERLYSYKYSIADSFYYQQTYNILKYFWALFPRFWNRKSGILVTDGQNHD